MYRLLITILTLSLSQHIIALPDDEYQPIKIQADSATRDEKNGITIDQGNIIMQQGTLKIEAENITIKDDKIGVAEQLLATGKPVRLQQKPSIDTTMVYAEAEKINYQITTKHIELKGNAKLTQGDSQVNSDTIIYLPDQQIFKATQSQSANQSQNNTPSQRVEITIPAQKKPEQPQEQE